MGRRQPAALGDWPTSVVGGVVRAARRVSKVDFPASLCQFPVLRQVAVSGWTAIYACSNETLA